MRRCENLAGVESRLWASPLPPPHPPHTDTVGPVTNHPPTGNQPYTICRTILVLLTFCEVFTYSIQRLQNNAVHYNMTEMANF
jgi:hypothetical protein